MRKGNGLPEVNANIRRRLFYRALQREGMSNMVDAAEITAPPAEHENQLEDLK